MKLDAVHRENEMLQKMEKLLDLSLMLHLSRPPAECPSLYPLPPREAPHAGIHDYSGILVHQPAWLSTWLSRKAFSCNARDTRGLGSIRGSGRSPRGGNGNLIQYSSQENPMDRGVWQATVHGVSNSRTQLSTMQPVFLFHSEHDSDGLNVFKRKVIDFLTSSHFYVLLSASPTP